MTTTLPAYFIRNALKIKLTFINIIKIMLYSCQTKTSIDLPTDLSEFHPSNKKKSFDTSSHFTSHYGGHRQN